MKYLSTFTLCLVLIIMGCKNSDKGKSDEHNEKIEVKIPDSLYKLEINNEENFIKINAPEKLNFSLPDSSAKTEPYKFEDFNGDGKEDVMIYLGACGTGGCMYGLFLNQYDDYYKLAFMDYLKGPEFEKEKSGFWIINSFEEVEAYDPSKLHVSIYKFDQVRNYYQLDSTYISYDTIAY